MESNPEGNTTHGELSKSIAVGASTKGIGEDGGRGHVRGSLQAEGVAVIGGGRRWRVGYMGSGAKVGERGGVTVSRCCGIYT